MAAEKQHATEAYQGLMYDIPCIVETVKPRKTGAPIGPKGAGAGLGNALRRIVACHKGDVFLGSIDTLLWPGM